MTAASDCNDRGVEMTAASDSGIGAGDGGAAMTATHDGGEHLAGIEEVLDATGSYAYTNKGTSMMPLLREGRDVMVIRKKGPERCRRLDVILFRRPGRTGRGAYVLHRVLRVNGDGTYWVVGDNCVSGETVVESDVLGVLEAVMRDGRRIAVDSLGFRVYSHLWCDAYPLRFALLRTRALLGSLVRRCFHGR